MNARRTIALLGGLAAVAGLTGTLIARSLAGRRDAERNAPAALPYGTGTRIEETLTIRRSPHELYAYWRNLENLPSIMSHLERVDVLDGVRSHWTAKGPGGTRAVWDAEIIDDTPDARIAWRSVSGAVHHAGSVRFADAPGYGTEVRVEIEWSGPGGTLAASLASMLGGDPAKMVAIDLQRFKDMMEADRITTS